MLKSSAEKMAELYNFNDERGQADDAEHHKECQRASSVFFAAAHCFYKQENT
ncbi:hypothetical protein J31TS2_37750 [Bacillus licheniformis]|jgi:hypothetical protein|nr:hypothetical protein J31TS2_37750 [Bacillus licheniformis]GIN31733.1 hypothetical protein J2TS5_37720 [Bacillus licheniformis]